MTAALAPHLQRLRDKDKKQKFKLHNLELQELSLVDLGANQHADVVLVKRDSSADKYTPGGNRGRPLRDDEIAVRDGESDEERATPKKSPADSDDIIAQLRALFAEATALLTPETPISDNAAPVDIKDVEDMETLAARSRQTAGQAAATRHQNARQAELDAHQELLSSFNVASRNAAEALETMMRISGAVNPNPQPEDA